MYEDFYGFRQKPFALLPDPDFLYPSKRHQTALNLLRYGLSGQSGFIVITGEIGSGKTTLIHQLLNSVDASTTIGLITNTHISKDDLIRWVLLAFKIDSDTTDRVAAYKRFSSFVVDQFESKRRTVLIIDEAQNLDVGTLEELRMLSNLNSGKDPLLQIILAGQPELFETLNRPELRQFLQRVSANFHLEALNFPETHAYIRHRLRVAGGDPEIFDVLAGCAVYYFSQGIPRLINVLCDMALVYGFAEEKPVIDIETILDVVEDRRAGKLETTLVDFHPGDRDGIVKKIIELAATAARQHAKEARSETATQRPVLATVTDQVRDLEDFAQSARIEDPQQDNAPADTEPTAAEARGPAAVEIIEAPESTGDERSDGLSANKKGRLSRVAVLASVVLLVLIILSAVIEFVSPGSSVQVPILGHEQTGVQPGGGPASKVGSSEKPAAAQEPNREGSREQEL